MCDDDDDDADDDGEKDARTRRAIARSGNRREVDARGITFRG